MAEKEENTKIKTELSEVSTKARRDAYLIEFFKAGEDRGLLKPTHSQTTLFV